MVAESFVVLLLTFCCYHGFIWVHRLHCCFCGSVTADGCSLLVFAVAVFVDVIVGHWLWFLVSLCLLQSVV